ncbi:hypothetical protein PR048_030930 [Dryococelus australis]|uniref:Uncharacterized protein n=1 Tax=Dryococelus australis TaxID=614101 RepID=A0ABQ9GAA9_9NEOP|nr:hypothetical protein PR048_030930 [Dryococelus australis]
MLWPPASRRPRHADLGPDYKTSVPQRVNGTQPGRVFNCCQLRGRRRQALLHWSLGTHESHGILAVNVTLLPQCYPVAPVLPCCPSVTLLPQQCYPVAPVLPCCLSVTLLPQQCYPVAPVLPCCPSVTLLPQCYPVVPAVLPCCPSVTLLPQCYPVDPVLPCCPSVTLLPQCYPVAPAVLPCCPSVTLLPQQCYPVAPVLPCCPSSVTLLPQCYPVAPVLPCCPSSVTLLPQCYPVAPVLPCCLSVTLLPQQCYPVAPVLSCCPSVTLLTQCYPTFYSTGFVSCSLASYSPPAKANWVLFPAGNITCRNMAGRYHWLEGFLGDLPFPSPLYSSIAPYSHRFNLIGSQHLYDEVVVSRAVGAEEVPLSGQIFNNPAACPTKGPALVHDPYNDEQGGNEFAQRGPVLYAAFWDRESALGGRQVEFEQGLRREGRLFAYPAWGRGGAAVRLLDFHLDKQGWIPCRVAPGFSHVGIVPDDAAGRCVFSGISHFSSLCIPALLHTHLTSPS